MTLNDKLVSGADRLANMLGVSVRFQQRADGNQSDIETMLLHIGVP